MSLEHLIMPECKRILKKGRKKEGRRKRKKGKKNEDSLRDPLGH